MTSFQYIVNRRKAASESASAHRPTLYADCPRRFTPTQVTVSRFRAGTVYVASDVPAAYPAANPVSTSDICCTIYKVLGIDHETLVYDAVGRVGRPMSISHGGSPIQGILA